MRTLKIYNEKARVHILETPAEIDGYFKRMYDKGGDLALIIDWETTGLQYNATPLLLSMCRKGEDPAIIANNEFFSRGIELQSLIGYCNKWFKHFNLVAHNAKFDSMINKVQGIKDENCRWLADSLVMVHLYDPNLEKQLEKRVAQDFGYEKQTFEERLKEFYGKRTGCKWSDIDWYKQGEELLDILSEYAGEDTFWETRLYYRYKDLLDDDAWRIHNKIELPMMKILRDAKIRGVKIDKGLLDEFDVKAQSRIEKCISEIYEECGCVFNLNSPKQKKQVLIDKMGLPVISMTKSGQPSTDSASYESWAEMGYKVGALLSEYSELGKLLSGYITAIPKLLDENNVLRGDLNSCGTKTGRCCIEQTQRVMTVGGLKPIKDIEVGEMVYCYDNEGKVRIRKVLNKWNKGVLPLVKVKYQSSGNMECGSILCTPNHHFKTKNRGWVMAKDLEREKVYHLRRTPHIERGNVRPRLYGTHSFMELEQNTIKREYFNSDSDMHIHHKDGDTSNNVIGNLEILTHQQHSHLHLTERIEKEEFTPYDFTGMKREQRFGKDNPNYKGRSKWQLLKMLFKSGGNPTKVDMDFETFKDKCCDYGIELSEVCKRFNRRGEYISRKKLKDVADLSTKAQQKTLSLGYCRINELMEYYGVTNHLILSVREYGEGVCYDIEVEDFNNFICEEICVHNSSSDPNLQNQPNNHDFPIRASFIPREGYVFVNYDYSQLELRVMAHMSHDKKFMEIFLSGGDPHGEVAKACGITRKQAKVMNFGVLYGMGTDKYERTFGVTKRKAEEMIDNYHKVYSGFARWKKGTELFAEQNGYVRNLFGRIRKLPYASKSKTNFALYAGDMRRAVNTIIQGTGADIVKLATIAMCNEFEKRGLDAHFLLQVHDEVLIEAREDQMREIERVVIDCMEQTTILNVPLLADGKILLNWGEMKDDSIQSYPDRFNYGLLSGLL